jgi:pyridoxal 5'-phosphate synthase pdxS subunit
MMQLGLDGVFVGSGIFKSENPKKMASAIVQAVTNPFDASMLAKVSEGLGEPMFGYLFLSNTRVNISTLPETQRMAKRGW